MAFSGLAFACKPHFSLRPSLFNCIRKVSFSSVAAIEILDDAESLINHNSNPLHGKGK
ncbi:hypothetical protein Pint_01258 [Pistacia integerrima]|uniref:Uncharacterized protein n=2 Tax=Pistacia TaxID=55512 RepID=A0ACC1C7W0_9ROSI|nr:hypothetical protein Pint_01258 [Pistacia integerrima]KAJ0111697.1 hypothetical protein Patl1_01297 [Pistacia atlantica]